MSHRRLELLEELLASVARWSADGHDRRLPGVLDAFNAVTEWDNNYDARRETEWNETCTALGINRGR